MISLLGTSVFILLPTAILRGGIYRTLALFCRPFVVWALENETSVSGFTDWDLLVYPAWLSVWLSSKAHLSEEEEADSDEKADIHQIVSAVLSSRICSAFWHNSLQCLSWASAWGHAFSSAGILQLGSCVRKESTQRCSRVRQDLVVRQISCSWRGVRHSSARSLWIHWFRRSFPLVSWERAKSLPVLNGSWQFFQRTSTADVELCFPAFWGFLG